MWIWKIIQFVSSGFESSKDYFMMYLPAKIKATPKIFVNFVTILLPIPPTLSWTASSSLGRHSDGIYLSLTDTQIFQPMASPRVFPSVCSAQAFITSLQFTPFFNCPLCKNPSSKKSSLILLLYIHGEKTNFSYSLVTKPDTLTIIAFCYCSNKDHYLILQFYT